jgi:hypothetical protein
MQAVRKYLSAARNMVESVEYRVDQWIMSNPVAILRRWRFRSAQKRVFNPLYRRLSIVGTPIPYLKASIS